VTRGEKGQTGGHGGGKVGNNQSIITRTEKERGLEGGDARRSAKKYTETSKIMAGKDIENVKIVRGNETREGGGTERKGKKAKRGKRAKERVLKDWTGATDGTRKFECMNAATGERL